MFPMLCEIDEMIDFKMRDLDDSPLNSIGKSVHKNSGSAMNPKLVGVAKCGSMP